MNQVKTMLTGAENPPQVQISGWKFSTQDVLALLVIVGKQGNIILFKYFFLNGGKVSEKGLGRSDF